MCCSTNPTAMLMLALDALAKSGPARDEAALLVLPHSYVQALIAELKRTGAYISQLFHQLPPHEFMGVAIAVEDGQPFPQLVTVGGDIVRIECAGG